MRTDHSGKNDLDQTYFESNKNHQEAKMMNNPNKDEENIFPNEETNQNLIDEQNNQIENDNSKNPDESYINLTHLSEAVKRKLHYRRSFESVDGTISQPNDGDNQSEKSESSENGNPLTSYQEGMLIVLLAYLGVKIYDASENHNNIQNTLLGRIEFLKKVFGNTIKFLSSLLKEINDNDFITLSFLIMAIICFILFVKKLKEYKKK